jgi:hypothetical protein
LQNNQLKQKCYTEKQAKNLTRDYNKAARIGAV